MSDDTPNASLPPPTPLEYVPLSDVDDDKSQRVAGLISGLLRWGVRISLVLFVVGTLIGFARGREHGTTAADMKRLTGEDGEFPRTVTWLVQGLREGRGTPMVVLGLLLLIATPVLRVALSIGVFSAQRERAFVIITTTVLFLLILSFVLGGAAP